MTRTLTIIAREYRTVRKMLSPLETRLEHLKAEIGSFFPGSFQGKRLEIENHGRYNVGFKLSSREYLDEQKFQKEEPEAYRVYKKYFRKVPEIVVQEVHPVQKSGE